MSDSSGYETEISPDNTIDAFDALDLQCVIDSWRWRCRNACK